jgi:anti-sigma B factor antagonist
VEPHRERVSVVVAGEVDLAVAPEVTAQVRDLIEVGFDAVEVDLSAVTFIDLAGARAVAAAERDAAVAGCTLTVVPGPPEVQEVLALIGLVVAVPAEG